jgi:FixJ family two-component response regulator
MPQETPLPRVNSDADPATLVLVDDDPAVLNALRFAFETEGYVVAAFKDAETLLAALKPPREFACLVLDQRLAGMSGLALLSALRARDVAAPAILITTHPPTSLRKAAESAGVEIVEKPLLGRVLADKVRQAVARHRGG